MQLKNVNVANAHVLLLAMHTDNAEHLVKGNPHAAIASLYLMEDTCFYFSVSLQSCS